MRPLVPLAASVRVLVPPMETGLVEENVTPLTVVLAPRVVERFVLPAKFTLVMAPGIWCVSAVPAAVVKALQAGANMVLFGSPSSPASSLALARSVANALVNAVEGGTLTRTELESDAGQVLATRNSFSC